MSEKMLKFIKIGMQMPIKRTSKVRTEDFKEIYNRFVHDKAKEQSSRCSQCGVPFCQIHCPLHNNIPDWLKLTAEGRLQEAHELVHSTNNMPEICGSICPQDRLCEGNCVIERAGHGTVTIGSVEKYITDTAWEKGWIKPIKVLKEINQSVGIIGAGPAGLACAEELRKSGYKITIYDRYDRPGGLLIYGIPNFKLEKFAVERRTNLLKKSGIKFKQNFEVGKDISLDELRKKHDAILIATGVYKPREIELPGSNLKNIFPAMEFLMASNRKGLGDRVENFDNGMLDAKNKDIIVIGGGDTGMDCVRTAVRQNAKKFIGTSKISSVLVERMKLGKADSSGRKKPEPVSNSEFEIKVDMVIKALGFDPEDLPRLFESPDLFISKWGTIKINLKTMETNIPSVFAAGDIVRGASLVVWAIRDGRDATASIRKYLEHKRSKNEKAA